MNKKKYVLKVNRKALCLSLFLLPNLRPQIIEAVAPSVETVFVYLRALSIVGILLLFAVNRKKFSRITIVQIVFCVWYVISTIINGGYLFSAITICGNVLAIVLIIDFFADDFKLLISVLMHFFEILIYLNFLSIILHENGMAYFNNRQVWYFLGMDNNFMVFLLPAILVARLYAKFYDAQRRSNILIAICFATVFILNVASSIVALCVFVIVRILYKFNINLSFRAVFTVGIVVDILISFFMITERSNLLRNIIVNLLQKTQSLSSRTFIWKQTYKLILKSPLIGYGNSGGLEFIGWFDGQWVNRIPGHAHNHWLQLLFEGGVVEFGIFLFILLLMAKSIKKIPQEVAQDFIAVYAVFFVMCTTQSYTLNSRMILIFLITFYASMMYVNSSSNKGE